MFLSKPKDWLILLIIFNINNMNKQQQIPNSIQIQQYQRRLFLLNVIIVNTFQSKSLQQIKIIYQVQMQKQQRWQMIKQLCVNQSIEFKKWHQEKQFDRFHNSHYDWWAFPINRNSSYGIKYKVFQQDKPILDKDQQFITALRTNSILVCSSWGFDLEKGELIKEKYPDQSWQSWPIRLYKLANSLEYFKQQDLFVNAIKYGLMLIQQGEDFSYGPKDLKPLFFDNKQKVKQSQEKNSQSKFENPILSPNKEQETKNEGSKNHKIANFQKNKKNTPKTQQQIHDSKN